MDDLLSARPFLRVCVKASKHHVTYSLWAFLRHLQTQQAKHVCFFFFLHDQFITKSPNAVGMLAPIVQECYNVCHGQSSQLKGRLTWRPVACHSVSKFHTRIIVQAATQNLHLSNPVLHLLCSKLE